MFEPKFLIWTEFQDRLRQYDDDPEKRRRRHDYHQNNSHYSEGDHLGGESEPRHKRSIDSRQTHYNNDHLLEDTNKDQAARERMKKNVFPDKIRMKFIAFGQMFDLRLQRNSRLFSSEFKVQAENRTAHDTYLSLSNPDCYYQGYSETHANSSAAVSVCDSMMVSNFHPDYN